MTPIFISLVALLLLLTITQCSDNSDSSVNAVIIGGGNNSVLGDQDSLSPVIITDVWPRAFSLLEVAVDDGIMTAKVQYSGGCKEHFFVWFVSRAGFRESDPVQAYLCVRVSSEPDPCDAIITETVYFDLTPIADLYLAHYGTLDEIVLNVYEFGTDNKLVVSYNPALE